MVLRWQAKDGNGSEVDSRFLRCDDEINPGVLKVEVTIDYRLSTVDSLWLHSVRCSPQLHTYLGIGNHHWGQTQITTTY